MRSSRPEWTSLPAPVCTRPGSTATAARSWCSFPFQGAGVLVDRSLLVLLTVWLEAGSPRHVLGLTPRELLRLTRAETGVFVVEN